MTKWLSNTIWKRTYPEDYGMVAPAIDVNTNYKKKSKNHIVCGEEYPRIDNVQSPGITDAQWVETAALEKRLAEERWLEEEEDNNDGDQLDSEVKGHDLLDHAELFPSDEMSAIVTESSGETNVSGMDFWSVMGRDDPDYYDNDSDEESGLLQGKEVCVQ